VAFEAADKRIKLAVIPPRQFRLLEPFVYVDRKGRRHEIRDEILGETDLASVPWFMWWFVASYGRQTPAVLVHDQLVDTIDRKYADWVLRTALKELGFSYLRRWLVWSAVSLETRFRTALMPKSPTAKDPHRRAQREAWWVTPVGIGLVVAHLALASLLATGVWRPEAWLLGDEWAGYEAARSVGFGLLAAWFAIWRTTGILLLVAAALLGPALVVVLVTVFAVWGLLELGLVRLLIWGVARLVRVSPPPVPTPGPFRLPLAVESDVAFRDVTGSTSVEVVGPGS
jgi:Protein of unknown function (DUF1353)